MKRYGYRPKKLEIDGETYELQVDGSVYRRHRGALRRVRDRATLLRVHRHYEAKHDEEVARNLEIEKLSFRNRYRRGRPAEARVRGVLRGGVVDGEEFLFLGPGPSVVPLAEVRDLELQQEAEA